LTKATEALTNYKGRDENSPKKKAVEKATEAVASEGEAIEFITAQVFQLYSTLQSEEARSPGTRSWRNKLMFTPGMTYMESNMPKSVTGLGHPLWTG
jgi:hypothetical protein